MTTNTNGKYLCAGNDYKELHIKDIAALDCLMTDIFLLWKIEFFDLHQVLLMGAKKYDPDGYLEPNGKRTSRKEYHDSTFHHLALSYAGVDLDDESGLDHLLHAATNCLMLYTRKKRGIYNDKDIPKCE